MLAAVILAAGESRRMGEPKALADFRGRTFLQRLLDATRHPRIGVTRVVLGARAAEIRAALNLDPAIVVENSDWRQGQLSSIRAAIHSLLAPVGTATPGSDPGDRPIQPTQAGAPERWKPAHMSHQRHQQTEGMLLCPVDHPLISANVVAALIEKFDASCRPIVLPTFHGRRGHPVIFRNNLYEELLAASPELGARAVVWSQAADVLEVPVEEPAVVLNLNDPEALRQARERQDLI
ncbi:MAG: nucleotidyltransferase family protein [Candidatus Acidiferrales bacterium]